MMTKRQNGFTLVEIMVALIIFAIGMLGVVAQTANAIKLSTDNNARSIALDVASQSLENLYIAARGGSTSFKTAIDGYKNALTGVYDNVTVTGNAGKDSFKITITSAKDAAGIDVLANPGPYTSPITIGVKVTYDGKSGIKTAIGTYTYVLGAP